MRKLAQIGTYSNSKLLKQILDKQQWFCRNGTGWEHLHFVLSMQSYLPAYYEHLRIVPADITKARHDRVGLYSECSIVTS